MKNRPRYEMGPQDPKDLARDLARDLSGMVGELAALKADARHWLTDPEYAVLHLRLENAHAAVEAALIEARRRVRKNAGGRVEGSAPLRSPRPAGWRAEALVA